MSGIHIRDHNDPDDNAIVVAELNFGGPERLPGPYMIGDQPTPMPAPAAALGHASAQDIVQEERNTEKKAEANDSDPAAG
ncbi:uncharacterized protein N7483_012795 [Penicillium malachiteum]|uniref:uncharacterized protein n=1 Tax=Penicillium malachiteum TaxID=1324776 RepID=UPI0025481380|nr:uncharacterized protein N7483_012795 [Penicillium malachiteum]KAJ5715614.1 hypothetical protein N7483_012795 [Penicillium malachiteum]